MGAIRTPREDVFKAPHVGAVWATPVVVWPFVRRAAALDDRQAERAARVVFGRKIVRLAPQVPQVAAVADDVALLRAGVCAVRVPYRPLRIEGFAEHVQLRKLVVVRSSGGRASVEKLAFVGKHPAKDRGPVRLPLHERREAAIEYFTQQQALRIAARAARYRRRSAVVVWVIVVLKW